MILDRVISVSKLTSAGTDKETYQTITGAEAIKMNIQPASAELTVLAEGQLGKVSKFFTTYSGLKIGYRITVSGTNSTFQVKGVEDWNFGPMPHYEGALIEMEE